MPISYVYTGQPMNGTANDDFMIAYAGSTGTNDNTINGNGGDDWVLADASNLYIPSQGTSNGSIANAFSVDASTQWTTDENPTFGTGGIPHVTAVVEATVGQAEYFAVAVGAGQTLTIDIDYGHGSPVGVAQDLIVEVLDGSGTILATFDDSEIAQGGLGSYAYVAGGTASRDPYGTYVAPSSATFYIRVRPYGSGPAGTFDQNATFVLNVSVTGHAVGPATTMGVDTINGGEGDDQLFGQGGADTIDGGIGNDLIHGGGGIDTINGGDGDDTLYGGAGNDVVHGGAGNDILRSGGSGSYYGDAGNDMVYAASGTPESLDGGSGIDTLDVSSFAFAYEVNLATGLTNFGGESFTNFENLVSGVGADDITGTAATNILRTGGGDDEADGAGGNDRIEGGDGADALHGGADNDRLLGEAGDDTLYGDAGNDTLDGGAGIDALHGGLGNDRFTIADVGDTAIEANGEGTDTVEAWISYSLAGQYIETLVLMGDTEINATGNGQANTLIGNGQDNILNGSAGADVMRGRAGDDRYIVDNVGDTIEELDGQGGDTVDSSVTYSLAGQHIEVLNLTGAAAINGTGNGLANRLVGNAAANILYGMDGNDRLDGGGGADTMNGGLGNDTFVVDNAGDVVQENDGQGSDTVEASISYSLVGRFIETLVLTGSANINATGNGLSNTLYGNAGNNTLNGMGGIDTMRGGAGDDRYIVDDVFDSAVELTGEGTDTVESSVTYSLAGQYVEVLTLTGAAAINGSGNGLANVLNGNGAANMLNGSGGNDALHGGLGSDSLIGGAGADDFWFDAALGAGNVDTIADFNPADDTIHLDRTIFSTIPNGALPVAAFRLGTAAVDIDDRILYDKPTGRIYYDPDGVGGAAAVLFAQVAANTNLTVADFFGDP